MKQMRLAAWVAVVCWGLLAGVGCNKPAPAPAVNPNLPTQAQPKLDTMKLWLGGGQIDAELALTPLEQQTGMMFRTQLPEQDGMLFVFQVPDRASFWMMNCPLPLSAAYIDPDGVIVEIHDLQPQNTNVVVAATDRIQFVLETSQGWFLRHNVNTGAVVRTEHGSLYETFLQNH
jgi:uncharacterized membrane protein (UPF0127 family)